MERIIYPIKEKAFIVGIDYHCYRAGTPAEIIGVFMGKPDRRLEPRLVYEVEYSDGIRDFVCVSEVGNIYKIITLQDIIKGKIPKVE